MTMQIPTLLALLGTALMAVAIFAPKKATAAPTVSLAPPFAAPPVERWTPPAAADEPFPIPEPHVEAREIERDAAWPALVDAAADRCDVDARLALVDALAQLGTPWSATILSYAEEDEPDERVRAAIRGARNGERA
jgi:nucleotide-binding universal stress UspA family protein